MVNMASLTGLMCRILLLTSVAYEDTNQITVEFSTPRTNPPSSMFFCFTSTNFAVTSSTIDILRMTEGGTIFSTNETVVVLGPYYSSHFFTLSTYDLNPIEVSTVYEVLATDPYYAGSYNLQRYDDLTRDQQGISISGMVDFPVVTSAEAGDPPQSGNCFLLTGAWKANSRYQMTILLKNPPPPASVEVPWPPPPPSPRPPPPSPRANNSSKPPSPSPPPPYSSPTAPSFLTRIDNSTPILWMAPITHTVGSGQELLFSVRGSKYGAACPLRPAIEPYMSTMFDACTESRKRGLGPAENTSTNVTTCLQLLRSVANQTANRGGLPFTAPPLTTYNLSSFPATSCTAANSALGPRFGGECISCGVYGVKQNSTCVCPRGILPNLVGSVACGEPISPDGNVTSLAALPEWLCRTLSSAKQSWQTKQLLDHNVAKQYVDAFTQLASPLLDQATVAAAFQEFNSTLIFDERRPDSPTRRYGIKPNCDECTNGQFKDAFSKRMTPLFDWHFDAMNTFRFLGYLLDKELQSPCPFLWDSSKPKDWSYGYYDEVICKPMPPGTCCGSNFEGT